MNEAAGNPNALWPCGFCEPVRRWFESSFPGPTAIQELAWETISTEKNALVIAPTGSGKTLAAFLFAIHRIVQEKSQPEPAPRRAGVRILYISPLKALGADVQRNLERPLAAMELASGVAVTTAVRTGDTTAQERRRIQQRPPDILITTPESLYLMLTSQSREVLRTVETVIVDEVHSIAGSKRGAHLSLSLERLDDLLERPAQRIGLSATVRPRESIARFLGGARPVVIVAEDAAVALDLTVRVPVADMAAVPAFGGQGGFGGFNGRGDPMKAKAYRGKGDPLKARAGRTDGSTSPDTRTGSVSIWPYIESEVLDQVLSHRSTIVFVNSRGLCERFTARLNELFAERQGLPAARSESAGWWSEAGNAADGTGGQTYRSSMGSSTELARGSDAVIAKAHHGSVAKARRQEIERQLKAGELPCVVATSSLELGIDMGEVDLVIQIAPPLSVASGLQRVGRANHQVGGRSAGIVYPRIRTELIDAAVMAEGMEVGAIEATHLVENALDVLAQQTVAAAASAEDGLLADEWYATVRRSACYDHLGKNSFESVLAMLAGRYESGDLAAFSPRILWDRETGRITARPLSQRLAVSNAGTIPDRGTYTVVLPEGEGASGRKRVGELDEEMVHESRVGDIIALGTSTWRIAEIGADRVVVQPAPGRSARLPFWHGEAPARPAETGYTRGAFLRRCAAALRQADDEADGRREGFEPAFDEQLQALGLDRNARNNLAWLLYAQIGATKALPTDKTLVVERCQDETGDWRVILHSPFGRKVHEPWALAVSERAQSIWGFDAHAAASDDGIVVRIPLTADTLPGPELFLFDPDELDLSVRHLAGSTSLFAARFRECAARALLTSSGAPGKRTPLWQQRLQGGQLLEAARRQEGFPLLAEALRECLSDVFDMEALHRIMADLQQRRIAMTCSETSVPSPLAAALVFGYVADHLYDGDMPHAERKASLLTVDPRLLAELLGEGAIPAKDLLDADAIGRMEADLQHVSELRRARGAEGAFDLLHELGPLTEDELGQRLRGGKEEAADAVASLESQRRAFRANLGMRSCWIAADDGRRLARVVALETPPWLGSADDNAPQGAETKTLDDLLARFARTHALWKPADAASHLGLGSEPIAEAVARLAAERRIVEVGDGCWADFDVLGRLRTASLAAAREKVKPVSSAAFVAQLLERQGADGGTVEGALEGAESTAQVISQFEGVFLPMRTWDEVVLPARVARYRPAFLDELVAAGEVLWVGNERQQIAFFPTDSPLAPLPCNAFDAPDAASMPESQAPDSPPQQTLGHAIRHALAAFGPLTFSELVEALARQTPENAADQARVARTLMGLAWAGQATNDGLSLPRADEQRLSRALELPAPGESAGGGREAAAPRRAASRRTSLRYREAKAEARTAAATRAYARSAFQEAFAGRWSLLVPCEASSTLQALGTAESLLDRYGVVSRDIALAAGVPGGLDSLMPVLRQMEAAGEVARGMFVDGLGPAQFATREVVEHLRDIQSALSCDDASRNPAGGPTATESARKAVVLDAEDPANLFGAGIPWPAVSETAVGDTAPIDSALPAAKPNRREGAAVAIADGAPVLWAAPGLKSLLLFADDDALILRSLRALVAREKAAAKRRGSAGARTKLVVETVNARPVLATPTVALLQQAGFVRLPNGMRLYVDPF